MLSTNNLAITCLSASLDSLNNKLELMENMFDAGRPSNMIKPSWKLLKREYKIMMKLYECREEQLELLNAIESDKEHDKATYTKEQIIENSQKGKLPDSAVTQPKQNAKEQVSINELVDILNAASDKIFTADERSENKEAMDALFSVLSGITRK